VKEIWTVGLFFVGISASRWGFSNASGSVPFHF
jgi:hypothetical protein